LIWLDLGGGDVTANRSGSGSGGERVAVVAAAAASDRYGAWLGDRWSVEVATGGADALGLLETEPAVLILDRDVSGIHADRILGIVRERSLDTRVVMLTAVEPGTDPLRLGFDDYVVKPPDRADLVETVAGALRRARYQRHLSEFYRIASQKASMEADLTSEELAADERYQHLRSELSAVRSSVRSAFERLADDDVAKLCSELSRFGDEVDDAVLEL
jgi:DNA-binding response OmpR family regulator